MPYFDTANPVSAKTRIHLVLATVTLLIGMMAWSSPSGALRSVMIVTPNGPICFDVEVADTWLSRIRGLMFRDTLSENQGMLFRYDGETPVTFWMKYVRFPLDLIFISKTGRIVQIHQNAQPDDPTPIKSDVSVSAVLEIRSGTRRSAQITISDTIDVAMTDTNHPCLVAKSAQ